MREDGLREVYVDCRDGQRFVERVSARCRRRASRTISPALGVDASSRAGAPRSICGARTGFARRRAAPARGFLVLIDYGHESGELYWASHSAGTLTTFRRHTIGGTDATAAACLEAPGECDITAHVDLTAVTPTAERAGLTVLGRLDQTYFLLGPDGRPETRRTTRHVEAAARAEDPDAPWRPRQHA